MAFKYSSSANFYIKISVPQQGSMIHLEADETTGTAYIAGLDWPAFRL
jgi:hypothetical protein